MVEVVVDVVVVVPEVVPVVEVEVTWVLVVDDVEVWVGVEEWTVGVGFSEVLVEVGVVWEVVGGVVVGCGVGVVAKHSLSDHEHAE